MQNEEQSILMDFLLLLLQTSPFFVFLWMAKSCFKKSSQEERERRYIKVEIKLCILQSRMSAVQPNNFPFLSLTCCCCVVAMEIPVRRKMHIVKVFVFSFKIKMGGFVKCVYCGYIFSVTDHQPVSQVDIIRLGYLITQSLSLYFFAFPFLFIHARKEQKIRPGDDDDDAQI